MKDRVYPRYEEEEGKKFIRFGPITPEEKARVVEKAGHKLMFGGISVTYNNIKEITIESERDREVVHLFDWVGLEAHTFTGPKKGVVLSCNHANPPQMDLNVSRIQGGGLAISIWFADPHTIVIYKDEHIHIP